MKSENITKTFVVLGMHGSGTSLVAKAMASQIPMGDEMLKSIEGREYGFWEDFEVDEINDNIVNLAGGNWMNPPSHESIMEVGKDFEDQMISLIERNNQKGIWGWKNPLTVLTIDLWYPLLTNPHLVTIFRDPKEVAESLTRYDKADIAMFKDRKNGIALAKEYNSRILKFLKKTYI